MRYHKTKSTKLTIEQVQVSTLCAYSWEDEPCPMETGCRNCHRKTAFLDGQHDRGIVDEYRVIR